jgi:hypothetical protein
LVVAREPTKVAITGFRNGLSGIEPLVLTVIAADGRGKSARIAVEAQRLRMM